MTTDERPTLVVIGPSASGKSSVVQRLAADGIVRVHPTWTTRPPRADEGRSALEHRFVSDHEYDDLDAAGFFLGTVTLPGLPYRYGLPRLALAGDGPIDTIMARVPFLDALAPHLPARLIYQIEDTPERARRRLLARGNDAIELAARLGGARDEARAGRAAADRVFVNDRLLCDLVDAVATALHHDLDGPTLRAVPA